MSYGRIGRIPGRRPAPRRALGAAGAAAAPVAVAVTAAVLWGASRRNPPLRDHKVLWYSRGRKIDEWGPMPLASAKGKLTKARKGAGPGDTFKLVKVRASKG